MATPHLVPLTVADPVTARILAAQLGAEGVVWEIRGNVGSPYPVGPVELLVDRDSLDLARELLAGAELPSDTELPDGAEPADIALVDAGPASEPDLAPDELLPEELPAEAPFLDPPARPARGRSWLAAAVVVALLVIAVARIVSAAL